jgi:uncharacterized membrane protein
MMTGSDEGACTLSYAGAAVAGAVAGMRSMAAPAIISRLGVPGLLPEGAGTVTAALAIGELIADKLPFMPNRTIAPGLITRAVSGGFSGGSITKSKGCSPFVGAAVGAAAAVGTAYAACELRKELRKRLKVPDFLIALAEDALVVGIAMRLLSRFSEAR